MREIRSYGSVGERGGNEPLYPDSPQLCILPPFGRNSDSLVTVYRSLDNNKSRLHVEKLSLQLPAMQLRGITGLAAK